MAIYRPKSSYKVFRVTPDTPPIYFEESGLEFTGEVYHQDPTTNEYFAGLPGESTLFKEKLIAQDQSVEKGSPNQFYVPKNEYDLIRKDETGYRIRSTVEIPTKEDDPSGIDYSRGIYKRYFAQHKQNGTVLEITGKTFRDLANKSAKYHYPSYLIASSAWILKGPVADQEINGYIVLGAGKENEALISELEKVLPNIRTYLTDPTQFVE